MLPAQNKAAEAICAMIIFASIGDTPYCKLNSERVRLVLCGVSITYRFLCTRAWYALYAFATCILII